MSPQTSQDPAEREVRDTHLVSHQAQTQGSIVLSGKNAWTSLFPSIPESSCNVNVFLTREAEGVEWSNREAFQPQRSPFSLLRVFSASWSHPWSYSLEHFAPFPSNDKSPLLQGKISRRISMLGLTSHTSISALPSTVTSLYCHHCDYCYPSSFYCPCLCHLPSEVPCSGPPYLSLVPPGPTTTTDVVSLVSAQVEWISWGGFIGVQGMGTL